MRIRVIAASIGLALGCASALAQLPVGYPATVNLPAGVRVGLAAQNGQVVWNSDLANWTNPLMVNQVEMTFAFGECFGGGMLDPLQANAAAANDDFSGTSAAQWNQFAIYRGTAGMNQDWVDTYTDGQAPVAVGPPPVGPDHVDTAGDAWSNDPYGTAPGMLGWETAQYRNNGNGDAITLTDMSVNNSYAILWSGQPNNIDWDQLNNEYDLLTVDYNYKVANIFVLAGNGVAPNGLLVGANLAAATPAGLQLTLGGLNGLGSTNQLLFWANDHGVIQGGNAPALVVPKYGGPGTYSPPPTDEIEAMYGSDDPADWTVQSAYVGDEIAVPEPSTIALVVIGIFAMIHRWRRQGS